jgi:hypothetical protein
LVVPEEEMEQLQIKEAPAVPVGAVVEVEEEADVGVPTLVLVPAAAVVTVMFL